MDQELAILKYADHYEKLTAGGYSLYMMINDQIGRDECLFGFCELGDDLEKWKELFSLLEKKAAENGLQDNNGTC